MSYLPTLVLKSSIKASMYILSKSTSSMSLLAQLAKRSGSSLEAVTICLVLSINSALFLFELHGGIAEDLALIDTLGGLGWSMAIKGGGDTWVGVSSSPVEVGEGGVLRPSDISRD